MSHLVTSETNMPVQRLRRLIDTDDGMIVQARWRGRPESENNLEFLQKVFEGAPLFLKMLLHCKNTPPSLF